LAQVRYTQCGGQCGLLAAGADRFYDNMEQMIGQRINPWLKICWRYLTPLITAVSTSGGLRHAQNVSSALQGPYTCKRKISKCSVINSNGKNEQNVQR